MNREHIRYIEETVARQRAFFQTGATKPVSKRLAALARLKAEIQAREQQLLNALQADLHKSHFEGYMCELGLNLDELGYLIQKTPQWARPQRRRTPLPQYVAKSYQLAEPYGVTLIMSPWNYPYLLSLDPLFGAVAAGNCVVLKPSAYAPHTSRCLAQLIEAVFPPEWVTVVEGGREQNAALLDQRFDYIFFTGSVDVGKMVMEKAAKHLTPVTLELGGKSPVIVDRSANIPLTAKRLAFGKLLNAGQTCVAPDYCLVDRTVKDQLGEELIRQYGPGQSWHEGTYRIMNGTVLGGDWDVLALPPGTSVREVMLDSYGQETLDRRREILEQDGPHRTYWSADSSALSEEFRTLGAHWCVENAAEPVDLEEAQYFFKIQPMAQAFWTDAAPTAWTRPSSTFNQVWLDASEYVYYLQRIDRGGPASASVRLTYGSQSSYSSCIMNPEEVGRLWKLYQSFEPEGPAGQAEKRSRRVAVTFRDFRGEEMASFILDRGGLQTPDGEYMLLRNVDGMFEEFQRMSSYRDE